MKSFLILSISIIAAGSFAHAAHATTEDRDGDGYSNDAEVQIYGTDPDDPSSNPAGVTIAAADRSGPKRIEVDLSEQRLRYYYGDTLAGTMLISSGLRRTPTPQGTFRVRVKKPIVHYRGRGYNFPNTKWNLMFLPSYYIHGAYWHNAFGTPRSHGCVNVSYAAMEKLYSFADVGTPVIIKN